jgi:uncharacterized protein (DUF1501 family)
MVMNRRDFLKTGSSVAIMASISPGLARAVRADGGDNSLVVGSQELGNRILVLVELNGGNDGLNTVIPYSDPAYVAARPGLAIPREQVLQLNEQLGLHPALMPLMDSWQAGDLNIALGVGYDRPDRSHFRSIEIWNTASTSEQFLSQGWAARAFDEAGLARNLIADSFVISGDNGPFYGSDIQTVKISNPDQFVDRASRIGGNDMQSGQGALDHILQTRSATSLAATEIETKLAGIPDFGVQFPTAGPFGSFGREMEVAAKIVASGMRVAAIKVSLGSFDTHANQPNTHRNLVSRLAESLAAFRAAMTETGNWDRVLVMTYAEFGRRVAQNGSNGTDHGTAAPHFILGGKVNGGFTGAQPSLTDLNAGDLKHTMDFRELFATASQGWWGLPPTNQTFGGHGIVPGLLA